MLEWLVKVVRKELSGSRAFDYVAGIARFHRIQASPGYRQAADWCARRLVEAGLEVSVLEYPARFGQRYWGEELFPEWTCDEAVLDLVSPPAEAVRLCDFAENPQSIIQRSLSTPPGGVRAEVVALDKADEPAAYESGGDVRGKFVLFTGQAQRAYELAVVEHGALGLVTDQMTEFPPVRPHFGLPDATQYTSFWPSAPPDPAHPPLGFVLSPAAGARLRRLLKGPSPVVLEARVRAGLTDGRIENVTAAIPGTGKGEVLLVAHLCHPKPSANDNASGCGTLLEVARTLQALISSGVLAPPIRSIRFLLVPEMTGTYAYLASSEEAIPHILAGLNLDMVGENQGLCGGPLRLEYPPLSCPDFTGDLLSAVARAVSGEARGAPGGPLVPLFHSVRTPFSGGSDHYILSDPTVGVPCPMFIQFPDRFYHTSADTLDKVDLDMLGRVGVMAATYLYFLASGGPREAAWLGGVMAGAFERDVSLLVERDTGLVEWDAPTASPSRERESGPSLGRRLAFLAARKKEGLRALAKRLGGEGATLWLEPLLADVDAAAARGEARGKRLRAWFEETRRGLAEPGPAAPGGDEPADTPRAPGAPENRPVSGERQETGRPPAAGSSPALHRRSWEEMAGFVPRRCQRGPVSLRAALAALPADRRAAWLDWNRRNEKDMSVEAQLVFWMDGRRTLAEVADCLELETGHRNNDFVVGYVEELLECGVVAIA